MARPPSGTTFGVDPPAASHFEIVAGWLLSFKSARGRLE
jgi:hypothetical protein